MALAACSGGRVGAPATVAAVGGGGSSAAGGGGTSGAIERDAEITSDGGVTVGDPGDPGSDGGGAGQGGQAGHAGEPADAGDAMVAAPPPSVLISEVMYHPVLENDFVERHEFIELYNPGQEAVSLADWKISGSVTFAFGKDDRIAAGDYIVIAKDKTSLLALLAYQLDAEHVFGDYSHELPNGGGAINLVRDDGTFADSLVYNDKFPWPVAADALGASDSFVRAAWQPLEDHQYRGVSLERVSFSAPTQAAYNWAPSPIDGPTPAGPNSASADAPQPIVEGMQFSPVHAGKAASGESIGAADLVQIDVVFSRIGKVMQPVIEYFVDDITRNDETPLTIALHDDGKDGDASKDDRRFIARLPAQAERSIVRYRVRADCGAGAAPLAPRPSDPLPFDAYYVTPVRTSTSRVYELFIAPSDWTTMWNNVPARVQGCVPTATWDDKVPATFVYNGEVFDTRVRYQGSRYNRRNGRTISSWSYPGPSAPSPLLALSWHITFPRYHDFQGRGAITLNKLNQGCPGLSAAVGFKLFREIGVPAARSQYARFEINGGYYHYVQDLDHPDDDMIDNERDELAVAAPRWKTEPMGHLFKSQGFNGDEGPYSWGDGRVIGASCGYDAPTRYAYTYDRTTWTWDDNSELIALIEGMNAVRAQTAFQNKDYSEMRTYLAAHFDLDLMLSYLSVMNWAAPFDDMFQNYYLYQSRVDQKWILMPWDLDLDFGGWNNASSSMFIGEQNDPNNRSGWWSVFKDSFIKAYRVELVARMKELDKTVLDPDHVSALVDEVVAGMDQTEAAAAPSGMACNVPNAISSFKAFATARRTTLQALP